ncbi:putative 3,4-dihydroxy-2-butanone kinase [Hibiscus syriacus]|uniref:3,4-dihydroxy-2-butanone kinase n=1 Tax=Hibiscus syriacus TaxID=106335 RepID=A0A6A3AR79_HIBSY|nr:putative 3,4-dihydroxy-2-butanone kinase [Hibiscus syriacus]
MALQGKKLINNPNGTLLPPPSAHFLNKKPTNIHLLIFLLTCIHKKEKKSDVVTEFVEGLVETYPGLQYLDGFPEVKVVIRADALGTTYDKVAVISGMLTAAICGDVFASPSVDSILAGIRAVTGPMGCLLIVTNYTDDRLNFGLAAEQARSEGYKIETVIVGDDRALPPPRGIAGRRGLAGTILVNKVAGAAAAAGLSLADVASEAQRASEMVGTMGVELSVCSLPSQVTSDRLGPGKMELGLGIHGEPGAAVADLQPVDVVVSHVLNQILSLVCSNWGEPAYPFYPLSIFHYLWSFLHAVGPGPPPLAELKAIEKGIDFFLLSEWAMKGRLIIESDCKSVVDWILLPKSSPRFLRSLVQKIASLILEREIIVRLIPGSNNCEADTIAKQGIG